MLRLALSKKEFSGFAVRFSINFESRKGPSPAASGEQVGNKLEIFNSPLQPAIRDSAAKLFIAQEIEAANPRAPVPITIGAGVQSNFVVVFGELQ